MSITSSLLILLLRCFLLLLSSSNKNAFFVMAKGGGGSKAGGGSSGIVSGGSAGSSSETFVSENLETAADVRVFAFIVTSAIFFCFLFVYFALWHDSTFRRSRVLELKYRHLQHKLRKTKEEEEEEQQQQQRRKEGKDAENLCVYPPHSGVYCNRFEETEYSFKFGPDGTLTGELCNSEEEVLADIEGCWKTSNEYFDYFNNKQNGEGDDDDDDDIYHDSDDDNDYEFDNDEDDEMLKPYMGNGGDGAWERQALMTMTTTTVVWLERNLQTRFARVCVAHYIHNDESRIRGKYESSNGEFATFHLMKLKITTTGE